LGSIFSTRKKKKKEVSCLLTLSKNIKIKDIYEIQISVSINSFVGTHLHFSFTDALSVAACAQWQKLNVSTIWCFTENFLTFLKKEFGSQGDSNL
jgi:hypothetical protein